MKKKYIFDEADVMTGGLVVIKDTFRLGSEDWQAAINLAYRICWQGGIREKAALTSLADGMVTEFLPLEGLVAQINRNGYRPATIYELMKMTAYMADQHTLYNVADESDGNFVNIEVIKAQESHNAEQKSNGWLKEIMERFETSKRAFARLDESLHKRNAGCARE